MFGFVFKFKIGLVPTDIVILKLIDAGIDKDNITIITTVLSGINIIVMLLTSKYTTGPKSMIILLKSYSIK